MNCLVCKTSKLKQSGTHLYCNTCNFTQFVVTPEYIAAAGALLGSLISNTAFKSESDLIRYVEDRMAGHLLALERYMYSIESGQEKIFMELLDTAKAQAINLQIEEEPVGEQTNDLKCCDDYGFIGDIQNLTCTGCGAKWCLDPQQGIYQPYFICSCGGVTYDEGDAGLTACKSCREMYLHDKVNDVFRKLV